MSKAYIVLDRYYSYNDETMNYEDAGNPVKVYTDLKDAEAAALKANIKKLKEIELRDYCYDIQDLCSTQNAKRLGLMSHRQRNGYDSKSGDLIINRFTEICGCSHEDVYDDEGYSIPKGLSNEQYEELFDLFDQLNFNYIQETELV